MAAEQQELEAACTAAEVGCNTTLIEASEQTGGLARAIANLPDKSRIADFPNYLANRAEKLTNLKVITGTKADTALIDTFNPDVVVNATDPNHYFHRLKVCLT